jgi:hypothetical protein
MVLMIATLFLDMWKTMDMPCIKIRNNARVRWKKGNILRNLSVVAQRNDLQKWKDSVSYGNRWIVETIFSCIKRMFGEYVYSVSTRIPDDIISKTSGFILLSGYSNIFFISSIVGARSSIARFVVGNPLFNFGQLTEISFITQKSFIALK